MGASDKYWQNLRHPTLTAKLAEPAKLSVWNLDVICRPPSLLLSELKTTVYAFDFLVLKVSQSISFQQNEESEELGFVLSENIF